jgi:multiple sugar transport system substrate-binding protein
MTLLLTRRALLAGTMALGATTALGRLALAQAKTLDVLCHRVHQNALTTGAAGDVIAPWREAEKAEISWTTLDSHPCRIACSARQASIRPSSMWASSSTIG